MRPFTDPTAQATSSVAAPYDSLLHQLIAQPHLRLESVIAQMQPLDSSMTLSEQLTQIDQLKTWLYGFRPLPPSVVAELKN